MLKLLLTALYAIYQYYTIDYIPRLDVGFAEIVGVLIMAHFVVLAIKHHDFEFLVLVITIQVGLRNYCENLIAEMTDGRPILGFSVHFKVFRAELKVVLDKLLEFKHLASYLITSSPAKEIVTILLETIIFSYAIYLVLWCHIYPYIDMSTMYGDFRKYILGVVLPESQIDSQPI
jgi:hypothetical protein